MASKYAAVFARLEKTLNTDASYQMKVEAVKQAMVAEPGFLRHGSSLATSYAAIRREKDALNEDLSECQVRLDATFQLMAEQFEAEGVNGLTLENGDKVRVDQKISVSYDDPEAFRQWCLQNEDLSRAMRLMPQTATKLVSDMLLEGQAAPPGVKASFYDAPVLTKGK